MPVAPTDADRGLQAERSILAWWRTALSAAVAGLLVVREALQPEGDQVRVVLTAVAITVLLGVGAVRVATLRRAERRPVSASRRSVAVFAVAAVVLQLLAVTLVLR